MSDKLPQYVEPLDDIQAQKIERAYVCSSCWGPLIKIPAPKRQWFLICPHCGPEATRGYVTRAHAERRRLESRAEANEARRNLAGLMPGVDNPHEGKSPDDLLNELGF